MAPRDSESPEVQFARLEERVISLDKKTDLYHQEGATQREILNHEIAKMNAMIDKVMENYDARLNDNHDKLNELRRDRTWIVCIFGLLWGVMLAYIQYKLKSPI